MLSTEPKRDGGPLQVAVGVVKNAQNQVLIALRPPHVHQGGLWEFPGGKIAQHETVLQALSRELQEELAIKVLAASPLITLQHSYTDLTVQLHVLRIDAYAGVARGEEGQAIRWVHIDDLAALPFPVANAPIITAAKLPDYYAILDAETLNSKPPLDALHKLLDQGIKLIQARLKNLSALQTQQFMQQALQLCAAASAKLLLNSSLPNALAHEYVHLTSHDLMRLQQRPKAIKCLAASCHTLEELQQAHALGVDFVALAPVLKTLTHPDAIPLGWEAFKALVTASKIPVNALGGLHKDDLEQAKQAGAQGIAGIRLFLD